MQTSDLVHVNATLNAVAFVLILLGLRAIRQAKIDLQRRQEWELLHKKRMLGAATASALFLVSYLVYHATNEPGRFAGKGAIKVVYLIILFSHVVLAVVQVPLILATIRWGLKNQLTKH